jgi:uncharacterized protein YjiS (DUF1127 family)
MSAYDFAAAPSGKVAHSAARLTGIVSDVYRAWKNRRAFYRLGELSDAELADIGLTRTDLHVVVASPFASDPTMRLRELADERIGTMESCARQAA